MKEKPPWLKVVGGTDHVPSSVNNSAGNEQPQQTEEVCDSELVRVYLDLSRKPPANFALSVRPDRVAEAAKQLQSWSVSNLHAYLIREDVWSRPSFTKAVFEEIRSRMLRGNLAPKE